MSKLVTQQLCIENSNSLPMNQASGLEGDLGVLGFHPYFTVSSWGSIQEQIPQLAD